MSKPFTTSRDSVIPGSAMARVEERIRKLEDWELILNEELREHIPEHADDLEEAWEAYRECELRIEDEEIESAARAENTDPDDSENNAL